MTARRKTKPDESVMGSAFLQALAQRVARNPGGRIVLPTGVTNAAEISRVLTALDRAAAASDRTDGD